MKIVLFLVSLSYILETTKAIRCLTCQNAKSNRECLKIGKVVECKENEDACQNEVRRDGRSLLITKRCKQSLACTNNFVQNNRDAWSPVQCNMEQPHTVCRCCCYDNSCNVDTYLCPNDCSPLDVPTDGGKQCQYVDRQTELGSECIFTCDEGYTLVGSPSSTCVTENYRSNFTHPTPKCVPITGGVCARQTVIQHGHVSCSDGSQHGSRCQFDCEHGYVLVGSQTTTCGTGEWSHKRPSCEAIHCNPEAEDIERCSVHCTNHNLVGSVCTYTCESGFIPEGKTAMTCNEDGEGNTVGAWSNEPPNCIPNKCEPPQTSIDNGRVLCSDGNQHGSLCQFKCDHGYVLFGSPTTTCNDDEWSHKSPMCIPIHCNPEAEDIEHGSVQCTNDNLVGSVCTFTCESGFRSEGKTSMTCNEDGEGNTVGAWSNGPPTCIPNTCEPPMTDIHHGQVGCTDGNQHGSVCQFQCDYGYFVFGSETTICGTDDEWSHDPPMCVSIHCHPDPDDFKRGKADCTHHDFVGSGCTFTCDPGFVLTGKASMTCDLDGEGNTVGAWSNKPPTCTVPERETCEPPMTSVNHARLTCSDENHHESRCQFDCEHGYVLFGSQTTICGTDDEWSHKRPMCIAIHCHPEVEDIEHGSVECTEDDLVGSVCTFTCEPGFIPEGKTSMTCTQAEGKTVGAWTNEPPTCIPDTGEKKCNNQGPLVNGGYGCSDESMLDSTCEFTCVEGYFLHPNTTSNTCEQTSSGTDWNRPMPCCSPGSPLPGKCPPYAVLDIVFSLDNPASVGQRAWLSQDRFRKTLQNQFVASPILAKFWNVLFDTEVVKEVIPTEGVDPSEIDQPYYHIGIALSYMLTDTFKVGEGERPDAPNVAIFVTDGNVPDELEVDWIRKNAQALRDSGVTIYAIGVGDKEPLEQTLNDLTVQANIYRVNTYTDLLDNVDVIAQMLCPNLCPAMTLA